MSAMIAKAVRDAIADPFALGDEAPAWSMPTELPSTADVRDAIVTLRARLEPTPAKDARWCLAKMRQRFGIGIDDVDAAAWLKTLSAFPRSMIFEAVRVAVTDDKRPTVEGFTQHPGLVRRRTDLVRAEAILAKLMAPKPVAPFQREPAEIRLRQLIGAAQHRGDVATAAKWERDLAAVENREPESWAVDAAIPTAIPEAEKPAAIVPSARNAVAMLRARARYWRRNGLSGLADRLELEASAADPRALRDERIEEAA